MDEVETIKIKDFMKKADEYAQKNLEKFTTKKKPKNKDTK